MWWQKKNDTSKDALNSAEYERLSKRVTELTGEVGTLKTLCNSLETDVANLRGKFNRKLSGLQKEEEKVEPKEEEKTESIINGGYVAFG